MGKHLTKLILNPMFRFVFWMAFAIWMAVMGYAEDTWLRWFDFMIAAILFVSAIENALIAIRNFRKE